MKLKSPLFWVYLAVNLYLISMLVFVSVQFFGGSDIGKISAFGSVLGGVGAFFAGFVAIYLFNDWRKPAKFELEKKIIYEIQEILREKYSILNFLNNEILRRCNNPELFDQMPISKDYYPDFNIAFVASELVFRFEEYSKFNDDNELKLNYLNFVELLKSYHYYFPEILSENEDGNSNVINYKCNIEFINKNAFYFKYPDINQKQPEQLSAEVSSIIHMLYDSYQQLTSKLLELLNPESHKKALT
ncbi:SoxR reducing system RseC family protein [Acinetobacter entericus]|uniref:Phage abortive infection protein n=1 Tax=Acinetobacter entericus TaxID=2989714 RepID=A0ABT3NJW4_9GAMM|nr:SoxR reducing system RseC family protein [Acinetobacter entericus]MCW8039808.1 hypothetical protein [Acinetobacter entericus]